MSFDYLQVGDVGHPRRVPDDQVEDLDVLKNRRLGDQLLLGLIQQRLFKSLIHRRSSLLVNERPEEEPLLPIQVVVEYEVQSILL